MTSPDTVFAVTRLTLGLARHAERSQTPRASNTLNGPHDVLDKRKRKRPEQAHDKGWLWLCWLMKDLIMTPGNTPLPRALTIEPPLLGHRYLPVSIAGDGAFSRTIIAQDVLHPHKPMVAIKAMKPGFEAIGQQVHSNDATN